MPGPEMYGEKEEEAENTKLELKRKSYTEMVTYRLNGLFDTKLTIAYIREEGERKQNVCELTELCAICRSGCDCTNMRIKSLFATGIGIKL